MNLLKNIKKQNIKEAQTNVKLFLVAFVCAIACWLIIAMTKYPFDTKIVTNIPVSFDTTGTEAAENGLKVLNPDTARVNVKFDCSRTDSNKLDGSSIRAYLDFDNVTAPGTRPLTVKVEGPNGATMSNVRITPATITVELDQFSHKEFALEAKIPKITPADGKSLNNDEITCSPAMISVTGPSSQLARIAKCYAVCDKSEVLDSTKTLNSERFELLYDDGTPVDLSEKSHIKIENSSIVSIYVPVLTLKTVHLKPQFIGAPSSFDTRCLDYTITPETVTIAAKTSDTNLTDPLQFKIELSALDIDYSQDIDMNSLLAANNLMNISDIATFNFKLNSDGLASKEIALTKDDINLLNQPSDDYNYEIIRDRLVVKLVGPSDVIENITAKDLSAVVDLLGADVSMNQFQYDVTISCNTHNNVWAVGNSKVTVKKTLKEGVTTQANGSSVSTTSTN